MSTGDLRTVVSLFLAFGAHYVFADYGFRFPRATDPLWLGQTINITWESAEEYMSLFLLFDDWNIRRFNYLPIIIASNITNTKSYQWTIPTNISDDALRNPACIGTTNGITEVHTFVTEQFYILPKQPQSPLPKKESKLGEFTSSGVAPGKVSIRENTPFTLSWSTSAEYVKLSFGISGNPYKALFPLFGITKNPGSFSMDNLTYTGWGQPHIFRLESNDTEFANITLDSEAFYLEPYNYPTTTMNSLATPTSRFIYPLKDDLDGLYTSDTYTFEWWPPLQKGANVFINAVCETWHFVPTTLFAGRTSATPNNLTWQLTMEGGLEWIKNLEGCPIHFNLIQTTSFSGKWDWSNTRLVARSDVFPFKGAAKFGEPRVLSEEKLKSRQGQLPSSAKTSGLSKTHKIVIGVVPFVFLCLLFGGIWRMWWIRRKRKLERESGSSGANERNDMPPELDGGKSTNRHEIGVNDKPVEGDYDGFIRELEDSNPAAKELDTHQVPPAELEGEALGSDLKDIKAIPVIRVDSPK